MINLIELQNSLQIDRANLDEELIKQPSLFYQVSEAYVEAVALRDTKKDNLAVVDAAIDGQIRERDEKTTEVKIRNEIQLHPNHQIAFDAYMLVKLEADKLGALKEAIYNRGFVLRDLVQLEIAGFYQVSSVSAPKIEEIRHEAVRAKLIR